MTPFRDRNSAWHVPISKNSSCVVRLSGTEKTFCLAKKIATALEGTGMSRQEFARRMDVQPSIITRWLSGHHNFTVATLFDIEDALQVQLLDIDAPVYNKTVEFKMTFSSADNLKQQDDLASSFAASLGQLNGIQHGVESNHNNMTMQHFSTRLPSTKK